MVHRRFQAGKPHLLGEHRTFQALWDQSMAAVSDSLYCAFQYQTGSCRLLRPHAGLSAAQ
jgi:hypothetical protein